MIELETKLSEAQVVSREEILLAAVRKSDVRTLEGLLHDELLFLASDGSVITKQVDLDAHRSGQMIIDELEAHTEEINIVDNTAIVVILYKTKGKMLGREIEGNYRYIRVWKLFPEGLKVIGGSAIKV